MKPVKIFVEGGGPQKKLIEQHSTDSAFLRDCVKHWFNSTIDLAEKNFQFIGGASEFKNMAPDIRLGLEKGFEVILIIDADDKPDGRKQEIEKFKQDENLKFPYFLFPGNGQKGEVENLLIEIATNKAKMDCYTAYEKCINKQLDIKDKVFAYIQAVTGNKELAKDQNRRFMNEHFDLDNTCLEPLKNFLAPYF